MMTYEEFIHKGTDFYMDMVRLIDIKLKYRMELTEKEKEAQEHILEFQKQIKINELRDRFEKCWEVDE
jgi:hypothetical protein